MLKFAHQSRSVELVKLYTFTPTRLSSSGGDIIADAACGDAANSIVRSIAVLLGRIAEQNGVNGRRHGVGPQMWVRCEPR